MGMNNYNSKQTLNALFCDIYNNMDELFSNLGVEKKMEYLVTSNNII